jgi:hypothetical protein
MASPPHTTAAAAACACRLTPNAFRNEGMTMQARIAAMKEQNWVDSDEFVKANATNLSPECRDLLDKIFVADEFKRITLQVGRGLGF